VKGRRIVSLGRKPSMFQARRSCILYPCENWTIWGNEYLW
jgi:hypothetical protein